MAPVVLPAVGVFDARIYVPHDKRHDAGNPAEVDPSLMTDRAVGAKILIEFTPDPHFELAAGNTISLVQIVRETIAKRSRIALGQGRTEEAQLLRENFTGGFPLRTVTDGSDDARWVIDHQLFTEQQRGQPTPGARAAAIRHYATARANAVQQLAKFPDELALVRGTPQPIDFAPGVGFQAGRQVSNFKPGTHKRDLQLVISRLRTRPESAAQQAVESVRAMLQYEYASRNTITLQNLDPRYAELRTTAAAARKVRPAGNLSILWNPAGDPAQPQAPGGGDLLLGHVFNAECNGAAWTTAVLSDEPTAPFKIADTITGGMEFEVAALLETGAGQKRFVGSVKWGWCITGQNAVVLSPTALSRGDDHNASATFFKAVSYWNAMVVPDLVNDTTHQPVFMLPTAGAELERAAALLDAALQVDDRELITRARDRVLETWTKLSAAEKTQHDSRLLDLLDRYEMKVNARRPSQLALRDQYKV